MINVSDRAVVEMKRFLAEQEDPEAAVHVFVESSCGCGKARYGMALGSEVPNGADVLEMGGIRLVIDAQSAPHLEGVEIDYRESLMETGFVIHNPNQQSSGCGCGG